VVQLATCHCRPLGVPFDFHAFFPGDIPNGTAREPFSHFVVYARSALAEQSTPSPLSFIEAAEKFQVMLGICLVTGTGTPSGFCKKLKVKALQLGLLHQH